MTNIVNNRTIFIFYFFYFLRPCICTTWVK